MDIMIVTIISPLPLSLGKIDDWLDPQEWLDIIVNINLSIQIKGKML